MIKTTNTHSRALIIHIYLSRAKYSKLGYRYAK